MNEGRYRWFVARGLLAQAEGDLDAALRLLDQAEQLYRPGFFPDVRPIPAMKARIWISHGKLPQAAGWVRDRAVNDSGEANYLSEFDHLTLVRLFLARHREHQPTGVLDQAIRLLERLHEAAETAGRDGSLLEIRLLQSLAFDAQGDRPRALKSLGQALGLAPEPEGYARILLSEGAPMLSLLRDATQHGFAGDADHHRVAIEQAQRLLSLGAATEAGTSDPGQHPTTASAESLSDRERQVLRLLASELSGPAIARELFVSPNTLRTHTKHIFAKLDVTSRRAAVLRARERGLI